MENRKVQLIMTYKTPRWREIGKNLGYKDDVLLLLKTAEIQI